MFHGRLGIFGRGVWHRIWSWSSVVVDKAEKGTGSFKELALLDKAGYTPSSSSAKFSLC
jgi:hypothetical protein